jgi:hypothetical protein
MEGAVIRGRWWKETRSVRRRSAPQKAIFFGTQTLPLFVLLLAPDGHLPTDTLIQMTIRGTCSSILGYQPLVTILISSNTAEEFIPARQRVRPLILSAHQAGFESQEPEDVLRIEGNEGKMNGFFARICVFQPDPHPLRTRPE